MTRRPRQRRTRSPSRRATALAAAGAIVAIALTAGCASNDASPKADDASSVSAPPDAAHADVTTHAGSLEASDTQRFALSSWTPGAALQRAIARELDAPSADSATRQRRSHPEVADALHTEIARIAAELDIDASDPRAFEPLASVLTSASSTRETTPAPSPGRSPTQGERPDADTAAPDADDASTEARDAPSAEALRLYARGRTARLDGRFRDAIGLLRDAAEADPDSHPPLRELGLAAHAAANTSLARSALRRAYELGDRDPIALTVLSRMAIEGADADFALDVTLARAVQRGLDEMIIADDPAPPDAADLLLYRDLHDSLARTGRRLAAAQAALVATDFPPNLSGRGADRDELLALSRDRARMLFRAGRTLIALDRPAQAAEALRRADRLLAAGGGDGARDARIGITVAHAWAVLMRSRAANAAALALDAAAAARLDRTAAEPLIAALLDHDRLAPIVEDELVRIRTELGLDADDPTWAVFAQRVNLPDAGDALARAITQHPFDDRLAAAFATSLLTQPAGAAAASLTTAADRAPWRTTDLVRTVVDAVRVAQHATRSTSPSWRADELTAALARADHPAARALSFAVRDAFALTPTAPGDITPTDAPPRDVVALAIYVGALVDTHDGDALDRLATRLGLAPNGVASDEPSLLADDPAARAVARLILARALLDFEAPVRATNAAAAAGADLAAASSPADDPARMQAVWLRARAAQMAGWHDDARSRYAYLRHADGRAPAVLAALLTLAEIDGRAAEARDIFATLDREHRGSAFTQLLRARALLTADRIGEAFAVVETLIAQPAPPPSVLVAVSDLLRAADRPRETARIAHAYLDARRPTNVGVWRMLLASATELGEFDAAVDRFDRTITDAHRAPWVVDLRIEVARAQAAREDAAATLELDRLARLQLADAPASYAAACRAAADFAQRGAYERALERFDAAPERDFDAAPLTTAERAARDQLAEQAAEAISRRRDYFEDSYDLLRAIEAAGVENQALRVALVDAAVQLGDLDVPAIFARSVAIADAASRTREQVLRSVARSVYQTSGAPRDVARLPNAATRDNPHVDALFDLLAIACDQLEPFPTNVAHDWLVYGATLDRPAEQAAAVNAATDANRLTEALKGDTRNAPRPGQAPFEVRFALSIASSIAAEHFATAEQLWRYVLSRRPNDRDALNSYGYLLLERHERLDDALDLLERAYANGGDESAAVTDSLGWAYYKHGRFRDDADPDSGRPRPGAITLLLKARDLANAEQADDAQLLNLMVIADHLGDAYWRAGDRQAALDEWGRAANIASGFDESQLRSAVIRREVARVRDAAPAKRRAAAEDREPPIAPIKGEPKLDHTESPPADE